MSVVGKIFRVIISLAVLAAGVFAIVTVMNGGFAPAGGQTSQQAATTASAPRDLSGYTWDELSAISAQISAAGGGQASIDVASAAGLCDAAGTPLQTVRTITLKNGTTVRCMLVGIAHDTVSGGGIAGLTLMTLDPITSMPISAANTCEGGWEACDVRGWLANDGMALLPDDLAGHVKTVDKLSNNSGSAYDAGSVGTTSDALWIPSRVEVIGPTQDFAEMYGQGSAHNDEVMNAEGSQYALFVGTGVTPKEVSSLLATPHANWWYRSAFPVVFGVDSDAYYYCCQSTGYPGGYQAASQSAGVLVGFCV